MLQLSGTQTKTLQYCCKQTSASPRHCSSQISLYRTKFVFRLLAFTTMQSMTLSASVQWLYLWLWSLFSHKNAENATGCFLSVPTRHKLIVLASPFRHILTHIHSYYRTQSEECKMLTRQANFSFVLHLSHFLLSTYC